MWSQARPPLWWYGDAANLYPGRHTPLLTNEGGSCLCLREEMEYGLPTDEEPFRAVSSDTDPEINRFAADWLSLHLFATLYQLTEQKQSAFAFLKNGGIKWASKVRDLTPETLAAAARSRSRSSRLRLLGSTGLGGAVQGSTGQGGEGQAEWKEDLGRRPALTARCDAPESVPSWSRLEEHGVVLVRRVLC